MPISFAPASPSEVQWSICARDVDADEPLIEIAPGAVLRTASLAKILALTEVAAGLESGLLDAEEMLDRRGTPRVEDSGLWHRLRTDVLPLSDVAALVGSVSDNWATNVLIERVGLVAIAARATELGFTETALLDLVRSERSDRDPPTLSVGNAEDWTGALTRMHHGEWVSADVSERVLGWLAASMDYSMVASAFARDPLVLGTEPGAIRILNKTGSSGGVRADAGLVHGVCSIAYACIANWPADRVDLVPAVLGDMRELGLCLADYVTT